MLGHVVPRAGDQRFINACLGRQGLGDRSGLRYNSPRLATQLHEVEPFFEHVRAKLHLALAIHDERPSVKYEFVLAAHHVEVDQRNASFLHALARDVLAAFLRIHVIRRAVDDEDDFGPRAATCRNRFLLPDVFADIEATANAIDLEDGCLPARCEVTFFVEYAVVRKQMLAVSRQLFAIFKDGAAVVNEIVNVFRKADDDGKAMRFLTNALDRILDPPAHARMKQQVFRRVAADAELRKQNDVSGEFLASARRIVEDAFRIPVNVADNEVKLGQRDRNGIDHA